MFFNKDDVTYFKAAGLTSGGLNGHIVQPLGEKGYFKCFFDGQIQCGQVIEMKLYTEESGLGLGMGIWGMSGCGYERMYERIGELYRIWAQEMSEGF